MSPALKPKKSEYTPLVEYQLRTATTDASPQRNHPREQQEAIEQAYRQYEPHVPSLPGGVKVAILVLGAAASWLGIISLAKTFAG